MPARVIKVILGVIIALATTVVLFWIVGESQMRCASEDFCVTH